MTIIRAVGSALLVLALVGCVRPSEGTGFAHRSSVHYPEALFDPASRSDLVRAMDTRRRGPRSSRGAAICPRETDLKPYGALMAESISAMQGHGKAAYSRAPRLFAHELAVSAYLTLMDLDMDRSRRDIDALRSHAGANAWIPSQNSEPAARAAIEAVGAVLPAWQILRQTSVATDDDRAVVEGWLLRVSRFTNSHQGGNSIGTQRGTNAMLLGLIVGDDTLYRVGLEEGFYRQLRGMRPDGSFPLETDRGRKALEHTGRNISLIVYAAQIGLSQGIDLYVTEVDGKSLDDAIAFLLRADDDNALVDVYARANRSPGRDFADFRPNSQVTPFSGYSRGWIKLYTTRFPRGELSEALLAKRDLGRRIFNDTTGDSVSCYATRL